MILRKYHIVYSVPLQDWELRRLDALDNAELLERYPTREAAIQGCKCHCGGLRCNGWVADLLAYDCDGRLAFEQLFEPGYAA